MNSLISFSNECPTCGGIQGPHKSTDEGIRCSCAKAPATPPTPAPVEPTPRTNAARILITNREGTSPSETVPAFFARTLERELTAAEGKVAILTASLVELHAKNLYEESRVSGASKTMEECEHLSKEAVEATPSGWISLEEGEKLKLQRDRLQETNRKLKTQHDSMCGVHWNNEECTCIPKLKADFHQQCTLNADLIAANQRMREALEAVTQSSAFTMAGINEPTRRLVKAALAATSQPPAVVPTITVCDKCLQASCWQGIFMCDQAQTAGTMEKTRAELEALALENPSYWETSK